MLNFIGFNRFCKKIFILPRPPVQDQQVDYPVPSNKTGAVIGKGGENIIAIKHQTGCQITQNKTNPPSNDPQWKYFTIRGQPDKVAMAQKLIQERVGGPPPPNFQGGPPAPPNPGMMGGPPRPPMGQGFAPPSQPAFGGPPQMPPQMPTPPTQAPPVYPSNAPPVVPHTPGQPYQAPSYPPTAPPAQAPPVQSQPPPVAQPAQPSSQPDHSAAWAAYYQQVYQQQQQQQQQVRH